MNETQSRANPASFDQEAKHTPGPWHVVEYNEGRSMDIQDAQGNGVLTKEHAGLIAAAPELLAALESILCDQETLREPYRNEALCEAARAAIARARGGA